LELQGDCFLLQRNFHFVTVCSAIARPPKSPVSPSPIRLFFHKYEIESFSTDENSHKNCSPKPHRKQKKTKKQRTERNKEKYFESTLEDMKQQKITEKQQ